MDSLPSRASAPLDVLVVADPVPDLNPAHDTTVAIIEAAQLQGHRVWVTTASDLSVDAGRPLARCQALQVRACRLDQGRWVAPTDWFQLGEVEHCSLDDFQVVMMRTDPPVDQVYLRATYVLDLADPARTLVMNEPAGLRNVNEKFFSLQTPHLGPPTLITASISTVLERVETWGRAVLKPTDAMAGRGIMILAHGDPNLVSLLEQATGRGRDLVVVQQWIEGVVDGDRRIIVLDGRPLGSVRRVACGTDFRCNMATGAVTVADEVTDDDRRICAELAPLLRRNGIVFAGIDVIGGLLTEVNVTSPTGVREIDALSGTNLSAEIVEWMESAVARRQAAGVDL
ncbi:MULTISPECIES: glutathione synthase [unclassified Nocardioides]|uniref:glutathione synthase n=1 Tax=unclassified Nocardioides TaxID=2615069 RepID=UPI0009E85461|nr:MULTISPECIES: glutathione synthase [unclassified Nocardioides]